jgi:hypothetical protein
LWQNSRMHRVRAYIDGFNLYDGFTTRIRQPNGSYHRQMVYLDALETHCTCLDIVEGRFEQKHKRCRMCGAEWISYEEKGTDVSIAIALVEDAARGAYDTALVVPSARAAVPGRPALPAGPRPPSGRPASAATAVPPPPG